MATTISTSDLEQLIGSVGVNAVKTASSSSTYVADDTTTESTTTDTTDTTTTVDTGSNSSLGGITLQEALTNQIHVNAQTGEVTTVATVDSSLTEAEKEQRKIMQMAKQLVEARQTKFDSELQAALGDDYQAWIDKLAVDEATALLNEDKRQEMIENTYNYTNSRSQTLYNNKAYTRKIEAQKAGPLVSGLSSENMAYKYDFDKLAKTYNVEYGKSYADFYDLVSYFNVSRLPDYDNAPTPFIGHIIMTRPSLYVDTTSSVYGGYTTGNTAEAPDPAKNFGAMRANAKTSAFVNDYYGKKLLRMLSYNSSSFYMPLFTTRAVSYSVGDVALRTVEKGGTFCGHLIKYGIYSEDHKIGGTISIDFQNDYYWSILKTIYIWMMYIDIASRSDAIRPSWVAQKSGLLDYCGSIYYLVTDMGGSKLIYWEKLTGVFPKSAPFSLLSMENNPVVQDKITIEFDYGMKSDPMDPSVLFDLNMLSGGTFGAANNYLAYGPAGSGTMYKLPDYSSPAASGGWSKETRPDGFSRGGASFAIGDAFAKKPIIQCVKDTNTTGAYSFYLHWLKS